MRFGEVLLSLDEISLDLDLGRNQHKIQNHKIDFTLDSNNEKQTFKQIF